MLNALYPPMRFARVRRDQGFDFRFPTVACAVAPFLSRLVILFY